MRKNLPELAALVLFSVFALVLLAFRVHVAESKLFLFLVWNLFLAWIPLWLAVALDAIRTRLALVVIAPVWLLFFPNAPYLVTDLVHLKSRAGSPFWLDLLLLASFAIVGLLIGLTSLRMVHDALERALGRVGGWSAVLVVCGLSGFGIYLGRFLRWNSWDVVTDVTGLGSDLLSRVIDPSAHPQTWGVTLVMGALLFLSYLVTWAARRPASSG